MGEYSYASDGEAFREHFKKLVRDIPRSNGFAPELMYKIYLIDVKKVDVLKLQANGEVKYKIYSLEYIGTT